MLYAFLSTLSHTKISPLLPHTYTHTHLFTIHLPETYTHTYAPNKSKQNPQKKCDTHHVLLRLMRLIAKYLTETYMQYAPQKKIVGKKKWTHILLMLMRLRRVKMCVCCPAPIARRPRISAMTPTCLEYNGCIICVYTTLRLQTPLHVCNDACTPRVWCVEYLCVCRCVCAVLLRSPIARSPRIPAMIPTRLEFNLRYSCNENARMVPTRLKCKVYITSSDDLALLWWSFWCLHAESVTCVLLNCFGWHPCTSVVYA